MRNQKPVKLIIAAVTLCMLLSVAPAFAFAQEGEGLVATWTFNADITNYSNYYYEDNNLNAYYHDGNYHVPQVVVTFNGDVLQEGTDYSIQYFDWYQWSGNILDSAEDCKGRANQDNRYEMQVSIKEDKVSEYGSEIENNRVFFYIIDDYSYTVRFNANYDGADPDSVRSNGMKWKGSIDPQTIPTFTREGYTFGGWYEDAECTKPFDVNAPFTYKDINVLGDKDVYAKWEKIDDPTPGGDDPVPGGDGTDDTDGGKPVPNTGVENMMPLFMWLFAVSGLIIFSIKKKRA
ncbi:MAG: InlB B-repeat-containing protein [Eubacteriales bacterium]|nr:InlB B-repeat-containing protein [Eubacteriales bacterium]